MIAGSLIQLYRLLPSILTASHHHPTRNAGAVAQGRLSSLLALEIERAGRAPPLENELRARSGR